MSAITEKANRLDTVPDDFYDSLAKFEPKLLAKINSLMGKLEIKNDRIKPTAGNLKIVNSILGEIKRFMKSTQYTNIVKTFGGEFNKQAQLTKSLFEEEIGEFKSNPSSRTVFENSRDASIALLLGDSLARPLFSPIRALLENSVSQNGLLSDLFENMSILITGNDDRKGTLSSYTSRENNIRDQFSTSDREFTQQSANLQGVVWYFYTGGKVKDTRKFCDARDGKYFHKSEIELWVTSEQRGAGNPDPSSKWQGQRPLTSKTTIFSFCGGYNCNHSLMPVSIFKVPKSVIQRNINNGNYTPTAFEVRQLGLTA